MASLLAAPYSEEAQADSIKTIDDVLAFLWNTLKIALEAQAKLANMGFTDLGVLPNVAETTADLRNMITDEVGLKSEGDAQYRSQVSRILDSWDTAKIRGTKEKEVEADQRVNDLPRRLTRNNHIELVRSYNKIHKDMAEKSGPGILRGRSPT